MDLFGLKRWFQREAVASSARKFFINTLFDSTFTLLGIVVGLAFSKPTEMKVLMGTMITSSLALGIASGVSVYEAETLERSKQVAKIEEAMLTDLDETSLSRSTLKDALVISFIVFLTPLLSCTLSLAPFILYNLGSITITQAVWISIGLSISTLFSTGLVFAEKEENSLIRGLRMAFFGVVAFLLGFWIESLF